MLLTCMVNAGMPYKFNHSEHACFARNYPEVLSHCGHWHDLTSVSQFSVINIADIRSAFDKTQSKACCSIEARQRQASMLVYIYIHM